LIPSNADAQHQSAKPSKDLRISVIDVEGGASALFVTPEGKSLLIDTGWAPGMGNWPRMAEAPAGSTTSSADRIAAAAQALGVTKIDYLLMTHYHTDHAGGVPALLEKLPVDTFVDHGANSEVPPPNAAANPRAAFSSAANYQKWQAAYQGHNHITPTVGQVLKIGSMTLKFVASNADLLDKPLPGAGQPNPLCSGVPEMARDGGIENAHSLGMVITFGKTRILHLGDNSWNNELKLLCPVNKIGKVDVYFVTQHGMDLSSSPPTAAFEPIVAVMQNGPMKGGDEAPIKTVESYPNLEGFWRLHYSVRFPDLNPDPNYIANLNQQPDMAYPINFDITPAGKITVTNPRNNFSKTYESRAARGH
jgi:beta-lactamase superfamily II metal-dependent hydrolase